MNRLHWLLLCFSLLSVIGLSYSPALQFDRFVYDGGRMLYRNQVVRGAWSAKNMLTSGYWGHKGKNSIGSYRPLALTALWAEYQVWGERVLGYVLTQMLWLFALCWMMVLLFRALGFSWFVAIYASLLFAVHPVHTEVVASLAGRADLMMGFFFLLALWLHLRKSFVGAAVVVASGLLCKELFIIFPLVVWTMDLCTSDESSSKEDASGIMTRLKTLPWKMYGLYISLTLAFLALERFALGKIATFPHGTHDNPLIGAAWWVKWLNGPMLLWLYIEQLFVPTGLSPDRTFRAVPLVEGPADGRFWLGLVCCCGLLLLAWLLRRKPRYLWLIIFAVIAYVPVSNLLISGPIIMADRWMLLVSVPVCVGLALGMQKLRTFTPKLCTIGWVAAFFMLVSFGLITFDYTAHWRSSEALFQYAVTNTPDSLKSRYIYGSELLKHRKPKQAAAQFREALRIQPSFFLGAVALVRSYELAGETSRAESLLKKYVKRKGANQPQAWMQWVLFLRRHRRLKEAKQADQIFRSRFGSWLKKMQRKP